MKIFPSRKNQVLGESYGDGECLPAVKKNGVRGGNLEFPHLCSALTFSASPCVSAQLRVWARKPVSADLTTGEAGWVVRCPAFGRCMGCRG